MCVCVCVKMWTCFAMRMFALKFTGMGIAGSVAAGTRRIEAVGGQVCIAAVCVRVTG